MARKRAGQAQVEEPAEVNEDEEVVLDDDDQIPADFESGDNTDEVPSGAVDAEALMNGTVELPELGDKAKKIGATQVDPETGKRFVPPETRAQISNTLKAHWEGKDGPMKGKTHSEETKKKISESLQASRAELEGLSPEERAERKRQKRYAYNRERNARLRAEKSAAKAAAAGEVQEVTASEATESEVIINADEVDAAESGE